MDMELTVNELFAEIGRLRMENKILIRRVEALLKEARVQEEIKHESVNVVRENAGMELLPELEPILQPLSQVQPEPAPLKTHFMGQRVNTSTGPFEGVAPVEWTYTTSGNGEEKP